MGLLVIYALRPNYRRLQAGTERKFQLREMVNHAIASFLVRCGLRADRVARDRGRQTKVNSENKVGPDN